MDEKMLSCAGNKCRLTSLSIKRTRNMKKSDANHKANQGNPNNPAYQHVNNNRGNQGNPNNRAHDLSRGLKPADVKTK
jgi:hypothetical protein